MAKDISSKEIFDSIDQPSGFNLDEKMPTIIKVVGVGGGGNNAINHMYEQNISGVSFVVINTDRQALSSSPVPNRLLIGPETTKGLGAGNNPEVAKAAAEESADEISALFDDDTKMVFITASMGGGTGTGAAPVVAGVAKEMGILTVGVVTIPFLFEKKQKIVKALRGIDELRKNVDALLIINNERLSDVYGDSDISVKESFSRADNVLKDAVKGIAELITVHTEGNINLDFRDVESTIRDGGGAIMAIGRASGKNRIAKAIVDALDSPLIHGNDIGKAKRILFNIYDSDEHPITVREMRENNEFFDDLDADIEVIWGTSTDCSLGEDVKVTILASGMEVEPTDNDNQPVERDDAYYVNLTKKLYRPITKPVEEPVKEPDFVVNIAPEPEKVEEQPATTSIEPTLKEKLKTWLVQLVEDESFER